jgi:hypothetical protein
VRGDGIDEAREDDRVDDVDAELDALEGRAPHDGQGDSAEENWNSHFASIVASERPMTAKASCGSP